MGAIPSLYFIFCATYISQGRTPLRPWRHSLPSRHHKASKQAEGRTEQLDFYRNNNKQPPNHFPVLCQVFVSSQKEGRRLKVGRYRCRLWSGNHFYCLIISAKLVQTRQGATLTHKRNVRTAGKNKQAMKECTRAIFVLSSVAEFTPGPSPHYCKHGMCGLSNKNRVPVSEPSQPESIDA